MGEGQLQHENYVDQSQINFSMKKYEEETIKFDIENLESKLKISIQTNFKSN